ncbi:MAG: MATE family efflux transporter [Lachnospiraceae bacterium]|nr:MATE family efflux transporter [Lachnospiraceae bacterium]
MTIGKSSGTKDLTVGRPIGLILGFSLPVLLGMLFQQFYSIVDTVIVGKIIGVDALAAVGSIGPVCFLIIGFCMGICSGFAIPVAQRFGAKDDSGLRRFVANSIWLSAGFAIVTTIVVCILARQILIWMSTPENIFEDAYLYMLILFLGIPVTFLYNLTSGIIRSLGDSKTPVYFLLMSSFINVGLDLLFIAGFHTGVEGAAIATVVSQLISGISCLIFMIRRYPILHMQQGEMKFDKHYAATLCNMGIPMGLQYSITAIGSVILQTAVNGLGSDAVASMTAANRINGFIVCPFDAMGSTMATYGGQNVGAKKLQRVKDGLYQCILLGAIYSVIALGILFLFANQLLMIFLDASETVIMSNARYVLIVQGAFYFSLALVNIVRFMIQGMGFSKFAILAGVFEMIARTFAGFILVPAFGFQAVAFASPIAWVLADAFLLPAFFHVYHVLERVFSGETKVEEARIHRWH